MTYGFLVDLVTDNKQALIPYVNAQSSEESSALLMEFPD